MLEIKELIVVGKEKLLVKQAAFSVAPGTVTYIAGANGSGKTSLLHGIFLHPHVTSQARSIFLDSKDLSSTSVQELFVLGVMYVPQTAIVLPGVSFTTYLHRAYEYKFGTAPSIIAFVNLCKKVCTEYAIPEYLLSKNVHENLSGGERKMQELIQVCVLKPSYVCIDEIDAGLDVDKKVLVARVLTELCKEGMGIVLTSHIKDFVENLPVTKIYTMHEGVLTK